MTDNKRRSHRRKLIRAAAFSVLVLYLLAGFSGAAFADYNKDEAMGFYRDLKIDELTGCYATADTASGQLIMSGEDSTKKVVVGNLVKLMTLLIAFEKIDSGAIALDTAFPVSQHAQDVSKGKVRVYLDAGKKETIRVEQAIEAICINGAQDAACALAEFLGGTEPQFAAMMNTRAHELGLVNTLFTDSTGIDEAQYSCAADIARIMSELVGKHPDVLSYLNLTYGLFQHDSTKQPNTEMVSSNPLSRRKFYDGSDGSMIGYSATDKYSVACTAAQEERRVVSVVLGEENENLRIAKVRKLAEYSLANYEYKMLCKYGTFVKKVDIKDGKYKKIKTETAGDFYVLLNIKESNDVKTAIELTEELKAPIEEGVSCGYVVYYLDEKEIGRVELITAESMPRANWFVRLVRWFLALFGL
ncbi:MAG: D-alanyl-D-alanine carboxypeptidase [Clostridia bacterium]|nr:D-alanyl-D-alanine carboxypeptidase [Clostridia bacterium]